MAVPFYDSFVAKNQLHFGISHFPDLKEHNHLFFEEDNQHPFDYLIKDKMKGPTVKAKSIFYPKKSHFAAYQFMRANEKRQGGKRISFYSPNCEHQCSAEFSFESWWKEMKSEEFPL